MTVNCNDCADNIPDKVNPYNGMCACRSFDDGLLKRPSASQIAKALMARGNRPDYPLFWPGKRKCLVFKQEDI